MDHFLCLLWARLDSDSAADRQHFPSIFGVEKSGIVYGKIFAFHQAGAAVAAFGGGAIYSILNSYTWAFALAGIFCVLASLFVLVIKKQTPAHGSQPTSQQNLALKPNN